MPAEGQGGADEVVAVRVPAARRLERAGERGPQLETMELLRPRHPSGNKLLRDGVEQIWAWARAEAGPAGVELAHGLCLRQRTRPINELRAAGCPLDTSGSQADNPITWDFWSMPRQGGRGLVVWTTRPCVHRLCTLLPSEPDVTWGNLWLGS